MADAMQIAKIEKELQNVLLISSELSAQVTFCCLRAGHLFKVARENLVMPQMDKCPYCSMALMADELRL